MRANQSRISAEEWAECNLSPREAVSQWLGRDTREKRNTRHAWPSIGPTHHKDDCDPSDAWAGFGKKINQSAAKSRVSLTDDERQFVEEFENRANRWRLDTSFHSSLVAKFMHDDYQTIMAMGEPVIPLILSRLKRAPEPWFWALKHLAKGFDAGVGIERPSEAAKAWMDWGKSKGYRF